jgi:transposase
VKVHEVVAEKFVGIDVSKATLDVPIDTDKASLRVATERARCGLPVWWGNPRQVRDFARAKGCLAKTDRVDAIFRRPPLS